MVSHTILVHIPLDKIWEFIPLLHTDVSKMYKQELLVI